MARPIPELPPITTATFPFKSSDARVIRYLTSSDWYTSPSQTKNSTRLFMAPAALGVYTRYLQRDEAWCAFPAPLPRTIWLSLGLQLLPGGGKTLSLHKRCIPTNLFIIIDIYPFPIFLTQV